MLQQLERYLLTYNNMALDKVNKVEGLDENGKTETPLNSINSSTLDVTRNSVFLTTLGLLGQISEATKPVTEAEIIEQRSGGIIPERTVEEVRILKHAELINAIENETPKKFAISDLGRMELALNRVTNSKEMNDNLAKALQKIKKQTPSLPPERYGNEEFRFTWDSIHKLLVLIEQQNAYRKIKIATLGCPMVGIFLAHCYKIIGAASVFDVNPELIKLINDKYREKTHGKVVGAEYNAMNDVPLTLVGRYDAVVMDPPWHNEYYCKFADRAWDMLRPRGRVYMSTFAPATRPEASKELAELYQRFSHGGFDLISIMPEFFGYEIPHFEKLVFATNGIDVKTRGNYGQLVILEKRRKRKELCTTDAHKEKLSQESSVQLSSKTGNKSLSLWIQRSADQSTSQPPLAINAANGGTVYTTTSRSKRKKDGVNLITNDHIGYKITNPLQLLFIHRCWLLGDNLENCAAKCRQDKLFTDFANEKIEQTVECAYGFLDKHLN